MNMCINELLWSYMNKDTVIRYFRDPPEIITERLILRRMKKTDYKDMYEYACSPDVTRFLTWDPHPNPTYTMRYLAYVATRYRTGEFYDWAVTWKESGKMIGTCGFTSFSYAHNVGEIGYVLNPDYWGRGIAVEAVRAVMRFGFFTLNLHRIEAKYIVGNARSRRVMEKAGMVFEGIQRESMYIGDSYKDIGICAILFSDYIDK